MRKEDVIKALTEYEIAAAKLRENISATRLLIMQDADAESTILGFLRLNEDLYLKMKMLGYDTLGYQTANPMEKLGTSDSFPSSLKEIAKGVWKFHLPPLYSAPVSKRTYSEGKHIYYLVMNLLDTYEKENGKIKKMDSPLIIFRHHIDSRAPRVFDYDNVDAKRAIDAMQGYFLKDDNIVYLSTMHEARSNPEESYCDIYVVDRATDADAAAILLGQTAEKSVKNHN